MKTKDDHQLVGRTNQAPTPEDSILLCKPLRHKQFRGGSIVIRGLKSKPTQIVLEDTLVSC